MRIDLGMTVAEFCDQCDADSSNCELCPLSGVCLEVLTGDNSENQ